MIIKKLTVENFRNLARLDIAPHADLNLFNGDNGAGKTSIVEAIVVLSRGRSFRTTQAVELVGPESPSFRVFAEVCGEAGVTIRLGLERTGKFWKARKNGKDLSQLSQLTRSLPLILMEPNSHRLISGAPENRRKLLDWGVFHVEPRFLETWQRYSKSMKQRNAALRAGQETVLESLERIMNDEGTRLAAQREAHFDELRGTVKQLLARLNPRLEDVELVFSKGWKHDSLLESLKAGRKRDMERGSTGAGPHRADIQLVWRKAEARNLLSRGEQKIVAAALLLAQADILARGGEKPVVILDDLASEFDQHHFEAVLDQASALNGQLWITGTELRNVEREHSVFHVEHGEAVEMV